MKKTLILALLLSSCKTAEVVQSNDCDCEKSNSQIRQENRTERDKIKAESKRYEDSLAFVLDEIKLRNKQLEDSLKHASKKDKSDARTERITERKKPSVIRATGNAEKKLARQNRLLEEKLAQLSVKTKRIEKRLQEQSDDHARKMAKQEDKHAKQMSRGIRWYHLLLALVIGWFTRWLYVKIKA